MKRFLSFFFIFSMVIFANGTARAFDLQAAVEAANPGDTIIVPCGDQSQPGQVIIDKQLTIEGDSSCAPKAKLSFSDSALGDKDAVVVQAVGVVLRNLWFYRDGASTYYSIISVPFVGWPPTYPYGDLTLQDSILEYGRYGLYVRGSGDITVENTLFDNQESDCIVFAGYDGGTATVRGNVFDGSIRPNKKALLIEPASDMDYLRGTINFENNTIKGKRNGVVFDFWDNPATNKVALHILGNDMVTVSGAIAFYYSDCGPGDIFDKLSEAVIDGNKIYDSGRAVYLDGNAWCLLSSPAPAAGQIVVTNNDVCRITGADTDTCIMVGSESAFCYSLDAGTLGATLDDFSASGNTACGAGQPMDCFHLHRSEITFGRAANQPDDRFSGAGSFLAPIPDVSDAVKFSLDGIDVTGPIPFGSFQKHGSKDLYQYRSKDGKIEVALDFEKCAWKVQVKDVDLSGIDPSDGVTHILSVGVRDGKEIVMMKAGPNNLKFDAKKKIKCCADKDLE